MVCQEERREAPQMVMGCLWRLAMVCQEEEWMAMVCQVECLEVELEKVMEVQGKGEDWS